MTMVSYVSSYPDLIVDTTHKERQFHLRCNKMAVVIDSKTLMLQPEACKNKNNKYIELESTYIPSSVTSA